MKPNQRPCLNRPRAEGKPKRSEAESIAFNKSNGFKSLVVLLSVCIWLFSRFVFGSTSILIMSPYPFVFDLNFLRRFQLGFGLQ